MKRFLAFIVALSIIMMPMQCFSEGQVIGHVYTTDIVAYINGRIVVSYNIGGKTAVLVEELIYAEKYGGNYGFSGDYDESQQLFSFNTTGLKGYGQEPEIKREKPGKIVGDVYAADARVKLNGHDVTAYNVGGRTAVVIEDIADLDRDHPNSSYGFSKYLCKYRYDDAKREIHMDTYIFDEIDNNTKLQFVLKDNNLTYEFDHMNTFNNGLNTDFSEEFKNKENYVIMPLYHNSEIIGDMYIDGRIVRVRCNEKKIQKIIEENDVILSYEEAQLYVHMNFDIVSTNEDDNALIYIAKRKGDESGEKYLLLALKAGGFMFIYSGNYDIFEVRHEDNRGFYLYCYPFAGTRGATFMTMNIDTEYFRK